MDATNGQQMIEAANRLAKTTRGRNAMRRLLEWLDDDGLGLDGDGKRDTLTLLAGAFGRYPGTARDAMRDVMSRLEAKAKRQYCPACDGVGWYEGGAAIRTECRTCNGTGLIDP